MLFHWKGAPFHIFNAGKRDREIGWPASNTSFHGNGFGEIARLVGVNTPLFAHVVAPSGAAVPSGLAPEAGSVHRKDRPIPEDPDGQSG